jgi:hypothetical protein
MSNRPRSWIDRAALRAAGATGRRRVIGTERSGDTSLLSRRETLRRGAGAAGAVVVAGSLLTAAPASALTLDECMATCRDASALSAHDAAYACNLGMRRFLGGFHSFVVFSSVTTYLTAFGACFATVLADDAYDRDRCIATCIDVCGSTGTCNARLSPPSGSGIAPPPQNWSPSGCDCVGNDTCCTCAACDGVGLCCIYGDCRCVP